MAKRRAAGRIGVAVLFDDLSDLRDRLPLLDGAAALSLDPLAKRS